MFCGSCCEGQHYDVWKQSADRTDFKIGDVYAPGFCLTTSADLNWKDTSVSRYRIVPRKGDKTLARAIYKVHDNTEKQVTFLQDAHFRTLNIA